MNTGQTMLTIGAMALLSILALSYYGTIGQQGLFMGQSQAGLMASTLATSYRERALNAYFDEAVKNHPYGDILTNPNLLSGVLGRESGETTINDFDDIDDFNGYVDTTKLSLGHFAATFNVYYVTPNNIDVPAGKKTFLKRIDIKVWRTFPPIDSGSIAVFDTARISCVKGMFKYDENDF